MATTSSATSTDLASGLRLAVTRTARRLRQEAGGGVSPAVGAGLAPPAPPRAPPPGAPPPRRGPLTRSAPAGGGGIRRPTAPRLVTKLEEAGFVQRTQDPDDGRS